ncbi:MAG: prephenate dehydrogenase/arogenate dehydrogenase family protein [Candidatus Hodarchaeales archaeon]|jgi:prephenate dehydrogenase
MKDQTIGIIGGKGVMGNFFKNIFLQDEIQVLISDIGTSLSNKDLVKRSDIVIIAVPIDKTVKIIEEISDEITDEQLLMDITSIKTSPVEAMLKSKADVIGMHPMFGPFINSIERQTIILTPARDKKGWQQRVETYFSEKKVNLKISTPEEHDKVMSLIQVLVHFNTLAIGATMARLGYNIKETLEFTSPIYRMELFMIGSILDQSARLYGNIPMYNPYTHDVLLEHKYTIEKISQLVLTKDLDGFMTVFKEVANYFNGYTKTALEEITFLTTKLVEYDGIKDNK